MMEALNRWWRGLRGGDEEEFGFVPSEDAELRDRFTRYAVRLAAVFVLLFAGVFAAFRWSGAAVEFGASRAAGRVAPTWKVRGVVRDARTREPVPWAKVEDDPSNAPPLFYAEADRNGGYELLTLAEPHKVRVSAPNYLTSVVSVGRAWFLWLPSGEEVREFQMERAR